jgi:hypothetical protein
MQVLRNDRLAALFGQFGDSLMEGDAIVGRMLDALQELGAANQGGCGPPI